eukprot:NODE_1419_length_1169_cov_79.259821_g1163_i0.p1 GENE.NODE_1419_length_1169_cov_79.259821_g1163_i0~~NODE_1419_length_1169_cov_79.259821_g1163_i0.p1  ORF type:complete len:282 (-),score=68.70 NODE_1419_length_1169_cov_79.259821_g1163_i0:54-899(-)
MPMGFMTLEDNVYFQFAAFTVFAVITTMFLVQFVLLMDASRVPMLGADIGPSIGVSMFCYSYAISIPSWVNEKRKGISPNKTIWYSAFPSTILKIAFGWFGGMAFSTSSMSDNALQTLADSLDDGAWSTTIHISDFAFSLFVVGFGVPLFHIYVRYNLVNGGVMRRHAANFWGVVFPWLISWLLYSGTAYEVFMNNSSIVFNAATCFIMPIAVYLVVQRSKMSSEHSALLETASLPNESEDNLEPLTNSVPRLLGSPINFTIMLLAVVTISIGAAMVLTWF